MSQLEFLPLLNSQRALYLSQILNPQSCEFTIAIKFDISEVIDRTAFSHAAKHVFTNTPALRLRFVETDDGPMQYVDPERELYITIVETDDDDLKEKAVKQCLDQPFNLFEDLPFRWIIIFDKENTTILQIYHHAALDGMAAWVISLRLADCYSACKKGDGLPDFSGPTVNDIVMEEEAYKNSKAFDQDKTYWIKKLQSVEPTPSWNPLPPNLENMDSVRATLKFSKDEYKAIRSLCETPSRIEYLLSAGAATLQGALSTTRPLVFGFPLLGRSFDVLRNMPFMQSTEACLVADINDETTIRSLIDTLEREVRLSLRHQRFGYERIRQNLKLTKGDPDLFALTLNFMRMIDTIDFGAHLTNIEFLRMGPVRDIALTMVHNLNTEIIDLYLEGHASRYNSKQIDHFLSLLYSIIRRIIAIGLDQPIRSYLHALEPMSVVGPIRVLQKEGTLQFEIQKALDKGGQKTAIVYDGKIMSYDDLNQAASSIANWISAHTNHNEAIIAVAVGRNNHLPIAMIGAVLSGYPFVPIDPNYPEQQIKAILDDCRPAIIITEENYTPLFDTNISSVCLIEEILKTNVKKTQKRKTNPHDVAAILYTSGSTGRPKGVELTQIALGAKAIDNAKIWHFEAGDCFAHTSSVSFDPSLHQLFIPIICHGQCAIIPRDILLNGNKLSALIETTKITHLDILPSLGSALIDDLVGALPSLKTIIFGGEVLKTTLLNLYQSRFRNCSFFNMYGPTEICVDATYFETKHTLVQGTVPLGDPLPNYIISIQNETGDVLPSLFTGEIVVGGPMISKGYLANKTLTERSFYEQSQIRFYRTGDLGFLDLDGKLFFVGRKDDQMKIRGFRVLISDIETALLKTGLISETYVSSESISDQTALVCYYKGKGGRQIAKVQILQSLSTLLPAYMIPARFVEVKQFFYHPNGKINRQCFFKELQKRNIYDAPLSSTTEEIIDIFFRVLGTKIQPTDHFFLVGGDSLSAIRAASLLSKHWGFSIHIRDLFSHPIVADLANYIDEICHGRIESNRENLYITEYQKIDGQMKADNNLLIAFNPVGSLSSPYTALLPHINDNWTMLGVTDERTSYEQDIETLANQYADLIIKRDNSKLLVLLGWSYGGIIAHAVAAALKERKIHVSHLVLIDSYFPQATHDITKGIGDAFSTYISKLDIPEDLKERIRHNNESFEKKLNKYKPPNLHVPLTYVRASDNEIINLSAMLAHLSRSTAQVIDVEECHFEMLKSPSKEVYFQLFKALSVNYTLSSSF